MAFIHRFQNIAQVYIPLDLFLCHFSDHSEEFQGSLYYKGMRAAKSYLRQGTKGGGRGKNITQGEVLQVTIQSIGFQRLSRYGRSDLEPIGMSIFNVDEGEWYTQKVHSIVRRNVLLKHSTLFSSFLHNVTLKLRTFISQLNYWLLVKCSCNVSTSGNLLCCVQSRSALHPMVP